MRPSRREAPLRGEKEAAAEGGRLAHPDTGADPEPAAAGRSLSHILAAKRRFAAKRRPPRKAQEPPLPTQGRIRSLQRQADVAERMGFEPMARCRVTGFQDQLLKPLGHLSVL